MQTAQDISRLMKVPRTIWGALVLGCGIYLRVAFEAAPRLAPPRGAPSLLEDPLALGLGAAAIMEALLAIGLYVTLNAAARRKARQALTRQAVQTDVSLEPGTRPLDVPRFFVPHIVAWAMSEAVVIMGLVLALLRGEVSAMFPFLGVGLALMFAFFPTVERFRA